MPISKTYLEICTEGPGVIAAVKVIQGALVGVQPGCDAWGIAWVEVPLHPVGAALPEPAHLMVVDKSALAFMTSASQDKPDTSAICSQGQGECTSHIQVSNKCLSSLAMAGACMYHKKTLDMPQLEIFLLAAAAALGSRRGLHCWCAAGFS